MIEDERDPSGCRNKQLVLDACEEAIRRLVADRRYFARPARSLFNEVRMHFAIGDQLRVWTVIDRNLALATEFLDRLPEGAILPGVPRECRAHTRRGTPCQREPSPGRDYCPSHKHLEEERHGPPGRGLNLELDADHEQCARCAGRSVGGLKPAWGSSGRRDRQGKRGLGRATIGRGPAPYRLGGSLNNRPPYHLAFACE